MPKANLSVQVRKLPLEERTLNFNFGSNAGDSQFPTSTFIGNQG